MHYIFVPLLTDTAPGLLGRVVFAAFYAILNFPTAWLANSCSSRNIITTGLEAYYEGGKAWN